MLKSVFLLLLLYIVMLQHAETFDSAVFIKCHGNNSEKSVMAKLYFARLYNLKNNMVYDWLLCYVITR